MHGQVVARTAADAEPGRRHELKTSSGKAALFDSPSPLAVADQQVSSRGLRRQHVQGDMPQYSRGQLLSEAAMDYVAGHVSDTAYGYLAAFIGKKKVPPPTPNSALGTQAGICTGAAVTLGTIVHHFGFTVRSVNFYYDDPAPANTPDGHVAVEVRYEGGWHFFDPTYGLFWSDASGHVLSVSDVRAPEEGHRCRRMWPPSRTSSRTRSSATTPGSSPIRRRGSHTARRSGLVRR